MAQSRGPPTPHQKAYKDYMPALEEEPRNAEQAKETIKKLEKLYEATSQVNHENELLVGYTEGEIEWEDRGTIELLEGQKTMIQDKIQNLKTKWRI